MSRPLSAWLLANEWRSRADIERDIDDELAFHLDMRVRELVDAGLSEAEARRAAEARFGDVGSVKSTCRRSSRNCNACSWPNISAPLSARTA
jgi:hypothetical protein